MSTEIKNTLFRFVTMRAPELIEKEEIIRLFVQHPDLGKSHYMQFFQNNPLASKKENLKNASANLKNTGLVFKNRDALKGYVETVYSNGSTTYNGDFFGFATWLTANRTKFSLEKLNQKISTENGIMPLDFERKIVLWDNLIYQIITGESSYTREIILSILVADLFLEKMEPASNDIDALRKLAQARVIMPNELFTEENQIVVAKRKSKGLDKPGIPTLDDSEVSKSMEITFIQQHLSELKNLENGLNVLEKRYAKENAKALAAYQKTYDLLVKDAYENAEKIETVKIDPVTKEEIIVVEYLNLNLPEFDFSPDQSEIEFLEKHAGNADYYWIIERCNNIHGYDTFAEMQRYSKEKEQLLHQMLFERTAKSQKYKSSNGILFPVIEKSARENSTDGVILRSMVTGQKKKLLLEFLNIENGISIAQADYTLRFDNGNDLYGTSKISNWVDGKLQVTLFNSEAIPEIGGTFTLEATFTTQNGREISIDARGNSLQSSSNFGNLITDMTYPDIRQEIDFGGTNKTYILTGVGKYFYEYKVTDPENPDTGTNPENPIEEYIPKGFGIRRLGIADYRKVEQEVCCYVPGEVSHIENVMASEYKERSTRRLRRSEDTVTTSKEKESEKLTDTSSTDRFEMNSEVASVLAEDTHVGGYAGMNAQYGKISMSAGADFANNTSSEESNSQAVTHAKEVTERVLDRVVQKVKEERISKVIEEFEENNKHGFDNRKNDKHVSGVYRWVDKIYKNKIINYGKRLMYEFMIPEPAAFHKMAVNENSVLEETIEKPIDPRTLEGALNLVNYTKINETTYSHWAGIYNVEVEPCPVASLVIGKSFSKGQDSSISQVETFSISEDIKITEGYEAVSGTVTVNATHNGFANSQGVRASLGNKIVIFDEVNTMPFSVGSKTSVILNNSSESVPFAITFSNFFSGSATVTLNLTRGVARLQQWQIETFNAIIKAYEAKLEEYNAKVSESKAMQTEKLRTNPLFYRQIENMVLRKNCIEYLVSHDKLGENSLITGNKLNNLQVNYEDIALDNYAAKVKFLEQAFEWELMSYNFYPFYWAYKQNWLQLYNVDESDDAIFKAFLQSGMARVILTIRPGFEEAVNWYMATGQVWNGGQVPTMNDKLFISIVDELRETEGEVEETWETRVPTSLTIIQAGSIGLEVPTALPCDDDCKDYKQFDSDGTPKLDEYGKPVSTNPFKKIEGLKLEGIDNKTIQKG